MTSSQPGGTDRPAKEQPEGGPAPKEGGPAPTGGGPGPTKVGYLIGAVLLIAIIGGVYLALTAGGNEDPGSAHIATPSSGSTNGVTPDERIGTPVETGTTDLAGAAAIAGCEVREELDDEGGDHIGREDDVPDYGTNPPTSGPHIGPPLQQADGAYSGTPAPEDVVHSLEHGRVAIQYDPGLTEDEQLEIKGLYDSAYSGALLFPNPDMPYAIAATTWTNLIACDEYRGAETLDAIRAFSVKHFGDGPEPIDLFPPLTGPSFADQAPAEQEAP
ncbi:MAG: DUF3105 domain-containing protein [Actinomycetota bacterium]|nr:DUF3105 domain-containing protein [Actinomycetota bacterium]